MKILSLIGACLLTLLTGCSISNNGVRVLGHLDTKIVHKNAFGDIMNVNFDNTNGRYRISCSTNSPNLASNRNVGTTRYSATFVFVNYTQTSIYSDTLNYEQLEHFISNQNLSSYYFGFFDTYKRYGTLDEGYQSILIRYYFVNPSSFKDADNNITIGTYSIYDGTWDNFANNHDDNEYYGGWLPYFDIANIVDGFYFDERYDNSAQFEILFGRYYEFHDFESTGYNEPQYHYSNTFNVIGNSNGINSQATLSFLPYVYLFAHVDNGNLGELYSEDITHSVSIDYQPTDALTTYKSGYDEGYDNGYDDGVDEGESVGYSVGYEEGNRFGYQQGFNEGVSSANHYTFGALFASIADTPVLIFRQLFSFDLFGVSALTVILSLFTVLVVLFIAKKIIK